MKFLEICFDKVNQCFPQNWLHNYENSQNTDDNESENIANLSDFIANITDCQDSFFYYINLSVISGEYISKLNTFEEQYNKIQTLLKKVEEGILKQEGNEDSIQVETPSSNSIYSIYSRFKHVLYFAINDYAKFITEIDWKLTHPKDIVYTEIAEPFDFLNSIFREVDGFILDFRINIKLAQIDNNTTQTFGFTNRRALKKPITMPIL